MVQRTRNFWLVFAALFAFSAMTTSCSDDDDDDDNGSPSVESGEASVSITGDKEVNLEGSGVTFTDTSYEANGQPQESISVTFADTASNSMNVAFQASGDNASIETGTYKTINQENSNTYLSVAQFRIDGDTYGSVESGNVEITSISEDNVVGTFNELEVSAIQGEGTITANGDFSAEAQ